MMTVPILPRPPQWIFLDFDGVIMDSMGLKLETYCYALEGFGFTREAIEPLQRELAGISRQRVIPLMYSRLTGKAMSEADTRSALDRFNAHDDASRSKMRLMPGALEFLVAASSNWPLAIVTGTPQAVIEKTVDYFDLRNYFRRICGTPGAKAHHVREILSEFSLAGKRCWFVGDAILDQNAADESGVAFIGLDGGDHPFRPGAALAITSLNQLLAYL